MLILVPVVASAEWYKDYEQGMELIKKNQYAQAIPLLQSAARQKNSEGSSIKFYGMKFGEYFPHYYLGRAYFYLKDYPSAMSEFSQSEGQGEIQKKHDLYQNLSDLKAIAGAQIAMANESGKPAVTTPPKKEEPPQVTESKQTEPPQVADTKQKTETPEPKKETQAPQNQQAKSLEAVKIEPVKKENVNIPSPGIQVPEETPREKSRKIVRDGARRYFDGDYDGAISLFLQALRTDSTDPSAQFLLGCSYAAKYLLSGQQDRKLLENASAAFVKAKRSNLSGPVLKNPNISPAILQMYQKTEG